MIGPNSNSSSVSGGVRLTTTLIACAWGLGAAYLLFYSLLIEPSVRTFLMALFPLVAVWATIERKRWGRLALLGLSSAALGLSAADIGWTVAHNFDRIQAHKITAEEFLKDAVRIFGGQSQIALAIFVLAIMTAFWLCRPTVRTEYERGKNATLAVAQRAIAMTVVGCWGVTFLLPTNTLPASAKKGAGKAAAHGKQGKQTSKRDRRAAESRTNA